MVHFHVVVARISLPIHKFIFYEISEIFKSFLFQFMLWKNGWHYFSHLTSWNGDSSTIWGRLIFSTYSCIFLRVLFSSNIWRLQSFVKVKRWKKRLLPFQFFLLLTFWVAAAKCIKHMFPMSEMNVTYCQSFEMPSNHIRPLCGLDLQVFSRYGLVWSNPTRFMLVTGYFP